MNRRQALQHVAWLLGGALSTPVISAVLDHKHGHRSRNGSGPRVMQTLTPEQDQLVTAIAEMIIPETDTPGAKAVRVNEFIDLLLTEWYPAEERERFLSGLTDFDSKFRRAYGKGFLEGAPEQQTAMLAQVDAEAVAARRAQAAPLPFFATMKELTLVGYYTSDVGMNDELQFQPATDRYEGCIPLERVGRRAWAELS